MTAKMILQNAWLRQDEWHAKRRNDLANTNTANLARSGQTLKSKKRKKWRPTDTKQEQMREGR